MSTSATETPSLLQEAETWLVGFEDIISRNDAKAFGDAFLDNGWLRDMLCFSWDLGTAGGPVKIRDYVSRPAGPTPPDGQAISATKSRFEHAGLHDFAIDRQNTIPSPRDLPQPGAGRGMQGAFTFRLKNPKGTGRGYFRLIQTEASGSAEPVATWKIFSLLLSLWDLECHKEPLDRPIAHLEDGGVRSWWEDLEERRRENVERAPAVVVVGAGQTGLMVAARLQRLGVPTLVIEKTPRVGDVWRKRYRNLTLHSLTYSNALVYDTLTRSAPKYLPRSKMANWLETYAINQDLPIWTNATLEEKTATYDDLTKEWTLSVVRGDSRFGPVEKVQLKPRHVILATGNGSPYLPDIKGLKEGVFKGQVYHSDQYTDAKKFEGKKVVVIGAGNSAGDICHDAYTSGAHVTMVQRSGTCVVSNAANEKIGQPDYAEKDGVPLYAAIDDIDLSQHSLAFPLLLEIAADPVNGPTALCKAFDREQLEKLEEVGFRLKWSLVPGGPEVGFLGYILEKFASGTMVDTGCVQLIIDRKVHVKSGYGASEMVEDGVLLEDGTKLEADLVVFATGYKSVLESIDGLFPPSVKLPKKVWGIDETGELAGTYRPIPQQGLWFAVGNFLHSRFMSRHLVLQILAQETGNI